MPVWLINALAALAALGGGLLIGWVDLQTSELIITMGLMFVLNMLLGFLAPRGGWFWPVLSVFGVPLLNRFPERVGLGPNPYLPRTVGSYLLMSFLLLIAALAGMLFGVIVRRSTRVMAG